MPSKTQRQEALEAVRAFRAEGIPVAQVTYGNGQITLKIHGDEQLPPEHHFDDVKFERVQ